MCLSCTVVLRPFPRNGVVANLNRRGTDWTRPLETKRNENVTFPTIDANNRRDCRVHTRLKVDGEKAGGTRHEKEEKEVRKTSQKSTLC